MVEIAKIKDNSNNSLCQSIKKFYFLGTGDLLEKSPADCSEYFCILPDGKKPAQTRGVEMTFKAEGSGH